MSSAIRAAFTLLDRATTRAQRFVALRALIYAEARELVATRPDHRARLAEHLERTDRDGDAADERHFRGFAHTRLRELAEVQDDDRALAAVAADLSQILGVEIDIERALTPPSGMTLDEHLAAIEAQKRPSTVDQVREKYGHGARVRVPRARPRERRASRARSRAAPADDSDGPEPHIAHAQRALPLGLVELLLHVRRIPHTISGNGALIVAWRCPACGGSSEVGTWFAAPGAACASGCGSDQIFDALLDGPS